MHTRTNFELRRWWGWVDLVMNLLRCCNEGNAYKDLQSLCFALCEDLCSQTGQVRLECNIKECAGASMLPSVALSLCGGDMGQQSLQKELEAASRSCCLLQYYSTTVKNNNNISHSVRITYSNSLRCHLIQVLSFFDELQHSTRLPRTSGNINQDWVDGVWSKGKASLGSESWWGILESVWNLHSNCSRTSVLVPAGSIQHKWWTVLTTKLQWSVHHCFVWDRSLTTKYIPSYYM